MTEARERMDAELFWIRKDRTLMVRKLFREFPLQNAEDTAVQTGYV